MPTALDQEHARRLYAFGQEPGQERKSGLVSDVVSHAQELILLETRSTLLASRRSARSSIRRASSGASWEKSSGFTDESACRCCGQAKGLKIPRLTHLRARLGPNADADTAGSDAMCQRRRRR